MACMCQSSGIIKFLAELSPLPTSIRYNREEDPFINQTMVQAIYSITVHYSHSTDNRQDLNAAD